MMTKNTLIAALAIAGASSVLGSAAAQVAGSTKLGVSATELTQVALGWSVKRSILDKDVYNDGGKKIGRVEDLIIAPDRRVSYLIIGAGGFIGVGRHDVAIPISQVQDKGGKLLMPGATEEAIKSMPRFDYADDAANREQFVAGAEQDIAKARTKVADFDKRAALAAADVKAKLEQQGAELKKDLKVAEERLGEMKRSGANRWKEFEGQVSAATARLRKAL